MTEGREDDWFSVQDMRPPPGPVGSPVEDDWLEEDLRPRLGSALDLGSLADRRVLVPAGLAVAFLLAVLAAAGAFSGGAPRTAATTTTTTAAAAPVTPTTTAAVPPAAGLPRTTLKPGATGAQVKVLQRALVNLGYSTGAADGQYGPATKQAVSAFQRANGLTADGVFGPKTLQALARAVSGAG
jgi:putative peptidoglycan binding protein